MSINLAKPMETVRQNPFVLCAWPSFADQPYITNYRIFCLHRPDGARRCSLPEERCGPLLRLLLA